MTDDALRALRDAVKAGTANTDHLCEVWPADDLNAWRLNCHAWQANAGSLDAAHALHKAVLPNALVSSADQDSARRWYFTLSDISGAFLSHEGADTPARAWLLAILEALIAQQGAGKGGE